MKEEDENHITKFETTFVSKTIPTDFRIDQLRKYAEHFTAYNLAPPYPGGSHGNMSFRIVAEEDPFIITASKTALFDPLRDKDFVKVDFVDFENNRVEAHGERLPSSESMIHFGIYRIRKDVNCILHGHSPEILANGEKLEIPETENEVPFGTFELVEQVLEVAEIHDFLVMKNHGFISMGKSMEEAWSNIESYLKKLGLDAFEK